jgi:hypothetical protein
VPDRIHKNRRSVPFIPPSYLPSHTVVTTFSEAENCVRERTPRTGLSPGLPSPRLASRGPLGARGLLVSISAPQGKKPTAGRPESRRGAIESAAPRERHTSALQSPERNLVQRFVFNSLLRSTLQFWTRGT